MYIREMIFFTRGLSLLCRELPCERVEWIQSSYGSASGVQGFITRIFDSWFQSAFVRKIAQARRTFHTRDSSSLHVSAVINPVLPPPPPLRACALVSLHLPITFIHSSDRFLHENVKCPSSAFRSFPVIHGVRTRDLPRYRSKLANYIHYSHVAKLFR